MRHYSGPCVKSYGPPGPKANNAVCRLAASRHGYPRSSPQHMIATTTKRVSGMMAATSARILFMMRTAFARTIAPMNRPQDGNDGNPMRLHFAYGLNMDPEGMTRRCPGSIREGVAILPDHSFRVTCQGVATVVRNPGDRVVGVLWRVPIGQIRALDAFEGVTMGIYRKTMKTIVFGPRRLCVLVYQARVTRPGSSGPGYMDAVVDAAKANDLPARYIARLARYAGNSAGQRLQRPPYLIED